MSDEENVLRLETKHAAQSRGHVSRRRLAVILLLIAAIGWSAAAVVWWDACHKKADDGGWSETFLAFAIFIPAWILGRYALGVLGLIKRLESESHDPLDAKLHARMLNIEQRLAEIQNAKAERPNSPALAGSIGLAMSWVFGICLTAGMTRDQAIKRFENVTRETEEALQKMNTAKPPSNR